jgi:Tol biopolymer transport system component
VRSSRVVRGCGRIVLAIAGSACLAVGAAGQETTRASVDSAGAEGDQASAITGGAISADGQVVSFESAADNLVPGDTNSTWDIFVHDRVSGITELVSVDSSGNQGDAPSFATSLSSDGQIVAFTSVADNLVPGDKNSVGDVFVHDRATGITERVSVDSSGAQANGWSGDLGMAISADGQVVVFDSSAKNLVAGGTHVTDIFVHDRTTGITELVSVDSAGIEANGDCSWPAISADGSIVAFLSVATNLVPGDTNGMQDLFVHDRTTGVTERVNLDSAGNEADGVANNPSISADGRFVAFDSDADDLVAGDTNLVGDVFVHDRATGTTERVSLDSSGNQGDLASSFPVFSADGTSVAYQSAADNLVPGDTNKRVDVFARVRTSGTTVRASVRTNGAQANGDSFLWGSSADGAVVTFVSDATHLVTNDNNGVSDLFVHELCSTAASWSNYGAGFPGTNGIPSFTSQQNPAFGTSVTLDLANSYGSPTAGLLFVGFQPLSLHSSWGGDLLVLPALVLPISFSYGGDSFSGDIPADWTLCGVTLYLQALESDPGAAKGVSFTPGLELVLGE